MNLELLKKCIDNCDAIFMDIFDTIIYRKNYPDYNKKLWCDAIKRIYSLNMSLNKIIRMREKVELKLRSINQKNGYSYEFNYYQFLEEMFKNLKIDSEKESFIKMAKNVEIDIEFNSQFIFKDALDIFEYANQKNKKIYCISDMYLTQDMILELFDRHKISNYISGIYVSSELLLNKEDGTIYDYVKTQHSNYDFSKCLMLGDNYSKDFVNSNKHGLNGFFVDRGYLYNYYEQIKVNCNYNKIINDLYNSQIFFDNFSNELYNYEQLKQLCYDIYKSETALIRYSVNDERVINRIKKLHNELYLHKQVNFVISKKTDIFVDNNHICFNEQKYFFKDFNKNDDCFDEITKCLVNKIYDKINLKDNKKANDNKNRIIPVDHLNNLGKQYAPLFKEFANWILNEVKKRKIKKVYFFTREGEFFKKVFDKINDQSRIKTYILEVSRVSTFFPSLKKIDSEELTRLWSQYSIQSLSALFKSLNIDINEYIDLIVKYNLSINDKILKPKENINLNLLFNDKEFKERSLNDLQQKKSLLKKYFFQKKFNDDDDEVAIVDIGWRGTIQDNLCYIYPNTNFYGYYFGLEQFLNEQPKNAYKYGYINQFYGSGKILGDVTPLEMLCNSCNGSTIGYVESGGKVVANRKIDKIENESYYNCTKYIQEGVIDNLNRVESDSKISYETAVNIIYNPDKYVAQIYFQLKHNEEFGLGKFVSKKTKIIKRNIRKGIYNWEDQKKLMKELEQTSWPYGYLVANNLLKYKNKLPLKVVKPFDSIIVKKRIAWIMPDLIEGSGGHRTIISNANYLVKKGYSCDLYFNEDYVSTSEEMSKKIEKYFGECLCQIYVGLRLRCNYDMVFATYSVITPEIVKNCNCKHKMYFVQDFEPWFNSMGDGYISMENSYRYNFRMISIGKWLEHKISTEYEGKISSFPFCADSSVYHPIDVVKEDAVCFIFQPDKPRRCAELGLKALRLVKAVLPNLKIYLYGSKLDYYVGFDHENLKIISLDECNKLYNKCKVGLCISSSNPSRIPFEMMAAGLPVVDVYRENNLYDMPDDCVTLAYSTPESIASSILALLDDNKLAQKKSDSGLKYMKNYDINRGYEIFAETVEKIFNDKDFIKSDKEQIYRKKPIPVDNRIKEFEFLLEYYPEYHETTDYLRRLVKRKRKIMMLVNPKLNIKRFYKLIFKRDKR